MSNKRAHDVFSARQTVAEYDTDSSTLSLSLSLCPRDDWQMFNAPASLVH